MKRLLYILIAAVALFLPHAGWAQEAKDLPDPMSPPRLVNDFAGMMSVDEEDLLEKKLWEYAKSSSTQISVVTINSLENFEVSAYTIALFKKWKIGQEGKNNGVLVLASKLEHKAWITVGTGLEGALTDAQSGRIFRNEMVPSFRQNDYYTGFSKAADAIIAATKGEYKADPKPKSRGGGIGLIVGIIIFIIFIIARIAGGGRRRGGYMSRRGYSGFDDGPWFGGFGGGGGSSGGGSSWGGGDSFGGFGGGDTSGGGAGGSW